MSPFHQIQKEKRFFLGDKFWLRKNNQFFGVGNFLGGLTSRDLTRIHKKGWKRKISLPLGDDMICQMSISCHPYPGLPWPPAPVESLDRPQHRAPRHWRNQGSFVGKDPSSQRLLPNMFAENASIPKTKSTWKENPQIARNACSLSTRISKHQSACRQN